MELKKYVPIIVIAIFVLITALLIITLCHFANKKNSRQQNVPQDEVTKEEDREEIIKSFLITKTLKKITEKPKESKESIFASRFERRKCRVFPEFILESPKKSFTFSDKFPPDEHFAKDRISSRSSCPTVPKSPTLSGVTEMDKKYDANACAICLCSYDAGENVSWSPNEECDHVFHTECISSWLMKSSECPVCRRNYLEAHVKKISDIELGC
uniref:RING-type domain-containing protein n=1 Tax=Corethron hystrix TaxID=216773 RepID=A0A7S1B772_9STRA|mmetsp:Transcript_15/g.33  ORF Transcript_15/g.33 Transcript_15/m.33 type:complete len:213 (+) Transcript_15:332-970(+)